MHESPLAIQRLSLCRRSLQKQLNREKKTFYLSFRWDREMKTNASLHHEKLVINAMSESGVAVRKFLVLADCGWEKSVFPWYMRSTAMQLQRVGGERGIAVIVLRVDLITWDVIKGNLCRLIVSQSWNFMEIIEAENFQKENSGIKLKARTWLKNNFNRMETLQKAFLKFENLWRSLKAKI